MPRRDTPGAKQGIRLARSKPANPPIKPGQPTRSSPSSKRPDYANREAKRDRPWRGHHVADPDNPGVQTMDLIRNSGLNPVANRLLIELQAVGDLVDGQVLVLP
jgi:hypothetical protein